MTPLFERLAEDRFLIGTPEDFIEEIKMYEVIPNIK